MILLDKPYVSEFLKETIVRNNLRVIRTGASAKFSFNGEVNFISEKDAIDFLNKSNHPLLYTNSENSINWIVNNLRNTSLPEKIKLFKDKVSFRKLLRSIYPDFFFKEVSINDIYELEIDSLPKPFIIKPSKGFFSMGVHMVRSNNEWETTKKLIGIEIKDVQGIYPDSVLDTSTFIIEELIIGEEYAFDAYFNGYGNPVILTIFKHLFSSENNFNDRIYFTSSDLIEKHHENFNNFLLKLGKLTELKNFPMHIEIRVQKDGEIVPVEINPMRFGGWCTTADITQKAYNFNPYEYFFKGKIPNWKEISQTNTDKMYSIVVLDNTTGMDAKKIDHFNFKKLIRGFEKPLECRKIDFNEFPVFGFLFLETSKDRKSELISILESDLSEFIKIKD